MAQSRQTISSRYPYLSIRGEIRGYEFEADALVDTGFTGYLALPTLLLESIPDIPDTRSNWTLADGRRIDAPLYFGTLEILGLPAFPAMIIAVGNEWILGRGAIDSFSVTFDHGQRVIVQR